MRWFINKKAFLTCLHKTKYGINYYVVLCRQGTVTDLSAGGGKKT